MNYRCHRVGGVAAATIILMEVNKTHILGDYGVNFEGFQLLEKFNISNEYTPLIIPVILLYTFAIWASIWPDIDSPVSLLGKKHPKTSRYIHKIFKTHGGHRGVMHYPITLALMCGILYGIYTLIQPGNMKNMFLWCCLGYFGGYASHILLDSFNSRGIAYFQPFSKVQIKIPTGITLKRKKRGLKVCWRYLSGSNPMDDFIMVMLCAGFVLFAYYKLY